MEDRLFSGKTRPVCTGCGHIHFSDPKVAAVTFIRDGARVLLAKRGMDPERGKWALPGGFVDRGEDPRDAAIREAFEETGLKIGIHRLLDVLYHPGQTDSSPIVILYEAYVIEGTLQPQDDVDELAWFSRDDLPEIAFDSTHQALEKWLPD